MKNIEKTKMRVVLAMVSFFILVGNIGNATAADALIKIDLNKVINENIIGFGWNYGPEWCPLPILNFADLNLVEDIIKNSFDPNDADHLIGLIQARPEETLIALNALTNKGHAQEGEELAEEITWILKTNNDGALLALITSQPADVLRVLKQKFVGFRQRKEAFRGWVELLEYARMDWVRVMTQFYDWEVKVRDGEVVHENDDDNPWTSPKEFLSDDFEGFAWNTGVGLYPGYRFILDFAEENDIWVYFNNWNLDKKEIWLGEKKWSHPAFHMAGVKYEDFREAAAEFGENVAAIIFYLATEANDGEGFSNLRFWGVWNEPGGGHTGYSLAHVDHPGSTNALQQEVFKRLQFYDKEMGTNVLEQVRPIGLNAFTRFRHSPGAHNPYDSWDYLLGRGVIQYLEEPDGFPGEITAWPSGDPYMDFISIHEYWSVFDYDKHHPDKDNHGTMANRLIGDIIKRAEEQIKGYDIDGEIEPILLGEVGAHAYTEGDYGPPFFEQSLFTVQAAIRTIQIRGVKGLSRWAWNMHTAHAAVSYPGTWYEVEPKGVTRPLDVNFFPYTVLTRYTERGSDILETIVEGGKDKTNRSDVEHPTVKAQRVWATTFRTPDGRLSIIMVNDSFNAKDIKIEISGLDRKADLQKLFVNPDHTDRIHRGDKFTLSPSSNILTATLLPRSVIAFTEFYTPVLSVDPLSLDFGNVTIEQSRELSFAAINTGGGTLTGSASLPAGPFSIIGDSSFSLEADQSTPVTVRFSPTAPGFISKTISFASNGGHLTVTVSGTGVEPLPLPPVTNFVALAGAGYVSLSWTNPPRADYPDFERVRIFRRTDTYPTAPGQPNSIFIYSGPGTSHVDTHHLIDGVTYFYTAFAFDRVGNYSAAVPSAQGSAALPVAPAAPNAACFIATAAYGTPMAEEIELLSEFRDRYLLTNEWGRRFVAFYYRHSPQGAELIAGNNLLKALVRMRLRPLIRLAGLVIED